MLDVISIGSAVRDVFLLSDDFQMIRSSKFEGGIGECVSLGGKLDLDKIVFSTGGGATNSAATFASLDLKAGIVAKLGQDENGELIMRDLERRKINTKLIKHIKNGETGYSTLLTTTNGERSILVYRGVSGEFTPQDIVTSKLKTKWLYLTSIGGNQEVLDKIKRFLDKNKTTQLIWNPGKGELKLGLHKIRRLLEKTKVLMVNKEEAQILIGRKKTGIEAMLKGLRQHDEQIIIITDGPNGTYALQDEDMFHAGTTDAPSISRAGAGDAFGSGFASALIKGKSLKEALRVGTLNAESVIGSFGAKEGILSKFPSQKQLNQIKIKNL